MFAKVTLLDKNDIIYELYLHLKQTIVVHLATLILNETLEFGLQINLIGGQVHWRKDFPCFLHTNWIISWFSLQNFASLLKLTIYFRVSSSIATVFDHLSEILLLFTESWKLLCFAWLLSYLKGTGYLLSRPSLLASLQSLRNWSVWKLGENQIEQWPNNVITLARCFVYF